MFCGCGRGRIMANYNCLLMDIDNTLLDFDAAEHKALMETLEHFELPQDAETEALYLKINTELWDALDRGEIKKDKLLVERFARFLKVLDVQQNPSQMNRYYLGQLATHADTIPGASEALEELAEVATLAAVSNGVERVQVGRMEESGLGKYMDDMFISEKMGVTKPSRRFFDVALRTLGIENRAKVLVVGDNLRADIEGGAAAGLATCWFNPRGLENDGRVQPTYTISSLQELYQIVMEEDELENVGLKNRRHML